MKINKLLLAIFLLGISLNLPAQLKNQNPQELTSHTKNLVSDLVRMDFSRFDFASLNSKLKSYPIISGNDKLALTPTKATKSETAESVITITVEDGKLISHLYPECADLYDVQPNGYFFLKAEGADVEFTKDESGRVNLIIKHKAVMPVKK